MDTGHECPFPLGFFMTTSVSFEDGSCYSCTCFRLVQPGLLQWLAHEYIFANHLRSERERDVSCCRLLTASYSFGLAGMNTFMSVVKRELWISFLCWLRFKGLNIE